MNFKNISETFFHQFLCYSSLSNCFWHMETNGSYCGTPVALPMAIYCINWSFKFFIYPGRFLFSTISRPETFLRFVYVCWVKHDLRVAKRWRRRAEGIGSCRVQWDVARCAAELFQFKIKNALASTSLSTLGQRAATKGSREGVSSHWVYLLPSSMGHLCATFV